MEQLSERATKNLRTALVLAGIALAFFVGFMARLYFIA
jgi:hypothetical protein